MLLADTHTAFCQWTQQYTWYTPHSTQKLLSAPVRHWRNVISFSMTHYRKMSLSMLEVSSTHISFVKNEYKKATDCRINNALIICMYTVIHKWYGKYGPGPMLIIHSLACSETNCRWKSNKISHLNLHLSCTTLRNVNVQLHHYSGYLIHSDAK